MSEQSSIPPSALEAAGEYRGYMIHRATDGQYEAYKVTGREGKERPKDDNGNHVYSWNGKNTMRIILPTTSYEAACRMLDVLHERKAFKKTYDPDHEAQAKMFPEDDPRS